MSASWMTLLLRMGGLPADQAELLPLTLQASWESQRLRAARFRRAARARLR